MLLPGREVGVWGRCLRGPGTGRYDCHTSHTCDLAHRQLRVSSWGFPPQKQEFEDRCPSASQSRTTRRQAFTLPAPTQHHPEAPAPGNRLFRECLSTRPPLSFHAFSPARCQLFLAGGSTGWTGTDPSPGPSYLLSPAKSWEAGRLCVFLLLIHLTQNRGVLE